MDNHQSNHLEKNKKGKKEPGYVAYAKYSGMAFQTGFIIAAFTFGGYKLDEWVQTNFPVFLMIGLFAGIFLGMYITIKDILKKK
jgi:F0F1-type ATP synthase assembly protein I